MRTVMEVAEKIGFQPDTSFEKFDEIAARFPDNVKKALDYHLKILSEKKYLQFDPSESYLFLMLVYDLFLPPEFAMSFRKLALTETYEIDLEALEGYWNRSAIFAIENWLGSYNPEQSSDPLFWWGYKNKPSLEEGGLGRFPFLLFSDVFQRAFEDHEEELDDDIVSELKHYIERARLVMTSIQTCFAAGAAAHLLCLTHLFLNAPFKQDRSRATKLMCNIYKNLAVDFSKETGDMLDISAFKATQVARSSDFENDLYSSRRKLVLKLKNHYTNGIWEALEDDSFMKNKLLTEQGYMPYCGGTQCATLRRTRFNGRQFVASCCNWTSVYSYAFIKRYKEKWNLK